jgi:hypothetical protein
LDGLCLQFEVTKGNISDAFKDPACSRLISLGNSCFNVFEQRQGNLSLDNGLSRAECFEADKLRRETKDMEQVVLNIDDTNVKDHTIGHEWLAFGVAEGDGCRRYNELLEFGVAEGDGCRRYDEFRQTDFDEHFLLDDDIQKRRQSREFSDSHNKKSTHSIDIETRFYLFQSIIDRLVAVKLYASIIASDDVLVSLSRLSSPLISSCSWVMPDSLFTVRRRPNHDARDYAYLGFN